MSRTQLYSSVKSCGGHIVAKFSQGSRSLQMRDVLDTVGASHGACLAFSANWIADHANDRDFWKQLKDRQQMRVRGGVAYTPGQLAALAIVLDHASLDTSPSVSTGASIEQMVLAKDAPVEAWLAQEGLVRKRDINTGSASIGSGHTQNQNGLARELGRAIAAAPAGNIRDAWTYRLISLSGGGAHAMAAFVGSADISFFDPNYGEFWFQDRAGFLKWFCLPGGFWWHSYSTGKQFNVFWISEFAQKA